MLACLPCARDAGLHDATVLPALAARVQKRQTGLSRSSPAMLWRTLRPKRTPWRRDKLMVVYRWLRRYVGGTWYRGGHHVGRMNGGPFIAEHNGRWYAEMR